MELGQNELSQASVAPVGKDMREVAQEHILKGNQSKLDKVDVRLGPIEYMSPGYFF